MPHMQEIELKFQIPAASLVAIQAELRGMPGGLAPAQRLQAAYFDTPDRKLARARAALRVRQEDDDWVQTLKAAGANAMTRLEDNQPMPPCAPDAPIRPDLSRHVDAQVRAALVRDLGWQVDADPSGVQTGLVLLYRTDMLRLRAHLTTTPRARASGHAIDGIHMDQVEIALDLGLIAAGERSVPVRELEIELIAGQPDAVLDAARDLVCHHGLWLDTQTKAHRGDQLAREAATGQPSPQPPARPRTRCKPDASNATRWQAALDAALDQASACWSEVAAHHADAVADASADPSASARTRADANDNAALPTPDAACSALKPWTKGWACGLRRLAWVWRHAPQPMHAAVQAQGHVSQAIAHQLAHLRPKPGEYLQDKQAAQLARAQDTTLLALDVLKVIVSAS